MSAINKFHSKKIYNQQLIAALPSEAQTWLAGLPWVQRRYVLSLCHVMCATSPEGQAQFLDEYTADGVVSRFIHDRATQQRIYHHLRRFSIKTKLTESVLRRYVRQFYVHEAQMRQRQGHAYLEAVLRLMTDGQEHNRVLSYILGFELLILLFGMSWEQHERFYRLQPNQEDFFNLYIRPVQQAHRLNGIIIPKDEERFFARRDYFVRIPQLKSGRAVALIMASFAPDQIGQLGASIMRHEKALQFDYEHIFQQASDAAIFE
ncbi:cobyrinic acid a,c-diamide synthase [Leptothoe kymatousa]|uniref:Cobyrinic acid a,c-diamide synthase n=1 Tax=Leptothoe kymatousa TAU-MAC 1615 TaxID=2364775 RepID=A0ABS5Y2Y9_9CYAN|nr:cobyrinic acid a,c-diamide synthase [Leptothoe kymatousa]MBT9311729.1 cobyrinic acid a,c-diamide synthase [Leptothoe kymatousa TAU-MAC 1615]